MIFNLEKIAPSTYRLPKQAGMKVDGLLIANEKLLSATDLEKPLQQLCNVAHLPGIVGYSVAMPDIHWGYGFPIGGVAAMRLEDGVISPGGVGYDINCGVRLAIIPIPFKELTEQKKQALIKKLFNLIPSGVGQGQRGQRKLTDLDYTELLHEGANWAIAKGFGFKEDLDHCESHGKLVGADARKVSQYAKERGKNQLGTIGSGNHFCEIGVVEKIFNKDVATAWGVATGQTYALIHSGSRGFGHQVCTDTLKTFINCGYAKGLPDRQLVAAPINSMEGKNYFAAMAAAANFAFNNRQLILHEVRQAFNEIFSIPMQEIRLIYDICHNIAKFEQHTINEKIEKVCVHRKGASRAFGPNDPELIPIFKQTGQPVIVPGDMGRASYLLVGLGNKLTFCSSCHGAGRARSRIQSSRAWKGVELIKHMKQQGVIVMASSQRTIAEEMPDAYKDVDEVVDAVGSAKLANRVARFKPALVIKG